MEPYSIDVNESGYMLFTINRPEKRNAISYEVMDGLEQAINRASEDDVKLLAITGAGDRAFCSGGDLSSFHSLKTEDEAIEMLKKMSKILYKLLTLRKPTVALMNGTAVGGGCELATACDYRIAKDGIKAGFVQGTLAITTGWGGGAMLMERLAPTNAMKMLMEASLYDTNSLLELGFIQQTYEGDGVVALEAFAEKMLDLDVSVLEAYKTVFIRKWLKSDIKERIKEEVKTCSVLWESEAHHLAVQKFMEKKNS